MELITRTEAKAQGLKTYFTGKPCRRGHLDRRRTSSTSCVTCENEARKKPLLSLACRHCGKAFQGRKGTLSCSKECNIQYWRASNVEYRRQYAERYNATRDQKREYVLRKERELTQSVEAQAKRQECLKASKAKWRKENPSYYAKYCRHKTKTDPQYVMAKRLRARVRSAFVANGATKDSALEELIGISIKGFMDHIESLFVDGMGWQNYGDWHLDHVVPCKVFDLTDKAEQKKCFHYSNQQPLWATDNLSKGASLDWVKDNA